MRKINGQLKKSIAERFKILRLKLNLSKKDIAKKLGISRNSISDIETQRQLPTITLITSIMRTFNVSYSWLLTGEGDMFLKEQNVELSQTEYFRKAFPDVPAEPDVIKVIESMAVPVMKNAIILKSFELMEVYRPQIEKYKTEKDQAVASTKTGG